MPDTTEATALRAIQRAGRGWAFSQRDFARLGSRDAIDKALQRLARRGTIRRAIRGVYDYPLFSTLLDQDLGPDTDQVAHALARKFGWRIQPSGPAAQNIIGLSTQVPARIVYLCNGPERSYWIGDVAEQQGRYISVNLDILVQEVVLPPQAAPWFAQIVKSVVHQSPVRARVTRSAIESSPHESDRQDTR